MHDLEKVLWHFISEYQYGGLYLLLSLGMVGIPVPDEVIMTLCGYQTISGQMAFAKTLFVAALGSWTGMNISYWIGRSLGIAFLRKISPYIHLNEKRLQRLEHWFQQYGEKLILIGYYFPGFRHATAYFSGISKVSYPRYLIFSGIGAFIWAATFISIGNVFGLRARRMIEALHGYLIIGGIAAFILVVGFYCYTIHKNRDLM
ncbi:MAG: DedA family protein [Peptococcaceae bacterium]|jgi:membrane protein DedA with SNARE-associated domain|nr:DedA family protein [Peptococcaceae bacterium]